jgi:hypothetical protein
LEKERNLLGLLKEKVRVGNGRQYSKGQTGMKCKYCENEATKTLIWLFDKQHRPARIKLPWCGCDLMTALRKIWFFPYQVVEGVDYEVEKVE